MHVLKECEATKDEMPIEDFLSEEGKGCNAMKKINKREEKRRRGKESGALRGVRMAGKRKRAEKIETEVGLS